MLAIGVLPLMYFTPNCYNHWRTVHNNNNNKITSFVISLDIEYRMGEDFVLKVKFPAITNNDNDSKSYSKMKKVDSLVKFTLYQSIISS